MDIIAVFKTKRILRPALVVAVAALVGACAAFDRSSAAESIAAGAKLRAGRVSAGGFDLLTYSRIANSTAPLAVYIEGDGLAWRSRTEISVDPTPTDPVGLRLAAADSGPNVLYIARPCQYPPPGGDRRCSSAYWTDRRFAEEVVAAIDSAIGNFSPRAVRLAGFSGGGAIAVLVAARRADVIDVRTIAGNLDHVALNRHHGVTQQSGSLNPADVAARLTGLPQLHLIGGHDSVAVPSVAESYLRRAGRTDCVEIRRVESATHTTGWIDIWRELAPLPVTCRAGAPSR